MEWLLNEITTTLLYFYVVDSYQSGSGVSMSMQDNYKLLRMCRTDKNHACVGNAPPHMRKLD